MHSVQEIGFSNNIAIPFKSNEHCLEDGPLYRALIQQLENRTQSLKISVKKILKALDTLLEARQSLTQANDNYIEALQSASFAEPLMSHYLNSASSMIHEQQIQLEQMLGSKLIDTLKDIYQNDIKVAEMKRRQFEETSKDYYASLAKYLKSSKKKAENQQSKKGQFDLDRFDYLSFLMDLHGGKKEYEILFAITDYARYDCHFYEETADQLVNERRGLDDLTAILKTSRREQETLTRERELKRNELVAKMDLQEVDPLENRDQFNVYKDVDTCVVVGHKKEGFLFATSKPVRNGNNFDTSAPWHKYWCVLSGGQLHEYSNWKRQLEPHIEPINLRFAAVRRVNNTDRRFCFEITTPYIRRMYQGTSVEETTNWVATIQNAIKDLLNGTHSSALLSKKPSRSGHGRSLSDAFKSGLSAMALNNNKSTKRHSNTPAELLVSASTSMERFRWSGFSFGNGGTSSKSPYSGHYLFPVFHDANEKLTHTLREDHSNHYCADCGASNPDWCSLNLGILLCIECSGIHRSLGTHISKVRSINLDSSSYTPDIIGLLCSIGNERSNKVWDPRANGSQPSATESRSTKLIYIKDKYAERLFVKRKENSTQLLFDAIDQDNIPNALYAIALGANPNALRPKDGSTRIPLVSPTYHLDDFKDGSNKMKNSSKNEHFVVRYALHFALLHGRLTEGQNAIFPMAELLLQNGANTSIIDPQTGLSLSELISLGSVIGDSAITYINSKNRARGQTMITRTVMVPSTSSVSLVSTEVQ